MVGSVEDGDGKWPDALGTVAVLESRFIPFFIKVGSIPAENNMTASRMHVTNIAITGMVAVAIA